MSIDKTFWTPVFLLSISTCLCSLIFHLVDLDMIGGPLIVLTFTCCIVRRRAVLKSTGILQHPLTAIFGGLLGAIIGWLLSMVLLIFSPLPGTNVVGVLLILVILACYSVRRRSALASAEIALGPVLAILGGMLGLFVGGIVSVALYGLLPASRGIKPYGDFVSPLVLIAGACLGVGVGAAGGLRMARFLIARDRRNEH